MKRQLGLIERILHPGGTDVGSTVVEHAVSLPCLQMAPDGRAAFLGGDIALEGNDPGNRLDGSEIDTNDEAVLGHRLGAHLTP